MKMKKQLLAIVIPMLSLGLGCISPLRRETPSLASTKLNTREDTRENIEELRRKVSTSSSSDERILVSTKTLRELLQSNQQCLELEAQLKALKDVDSESARNKN